MNLKISIITATFNASETLESCMHSVLSQDYPNIEYLIVDGGSTDNSLKKIKQKASQYSHIKWVSSPDQGIYDALNKGIDMATGDVIGFLHADDLLASPQCISEIAAAFEQYGVDGVYGDLHYVEAHRPKKRVRNWQSSDFNPKLLKRGWMPPHPTLYLKAAVYQEYGYFDISYKIASDYEFIIRIFKQENLRFHYLPQTLVKMRTGGVSNRNLKNIIKKSKEDYRAIKAHNLNGVLTLWFKNFSKLEQFF